MDYGRLNLNYKTLVDKKLAHLDAYNYNITFIYGGKTTDNNIIATQKNLSNVNPEFKGAHRIMVLKLKAISQFNQVKLVEKYLIDSLRNKYGDKCINEYVNDDEEIIYNPGYCYKIYIMYKYSI